MFVAKICEASMQKFHIVDEKEFIHVYNIAETLKGKTQKTHTRHERSDSFFRSLNLTFCLNAVQ